MYILIDTRHLHMLHSGYSLSVACVSSSLTMQWSSSSTCIDKLYYVTYADHKSVASHTVKICC